MPKIVRFDHTDLPAIQKLVSEFKRDYQCDFQDWQLDIIKTPHQSYSGEEDPILVKNERDIVKPIGEISFMLNAISDKLEHVSFLCIDKLIVDDKRVKALIDELQKL